MHLASNRLLRVNDRELGGPAPGSLLLRRRQEPARPQRIGPTPATAGNAVEPVSPHHSPLEQRPAVPDLTASGLGSPCHRHPLSTSRTV